MNKKITVITLAIAAALALTACSGSKENNEQGNTDSADVSSNVNSADFGSFGNSENNGYSDNSTFPQDDSKANTDEPTLVNREDIGDGQIYSGYLVNGIPNGTGELKFDIDLLDSKVLKVGSFKNGQLSGNGRTLSINNDSHLFCVGEYVDGVFSGRGYMENYSEFANDQYVSDQYYGEFKNGNLVSGERFHHNIDSTFLFDIGSFYQADNGIFLSDGYEIVYDGSGNILSCSSFSNGVEQSLTYSQFSEIAELQSYDVEYIVNVILARYGYEDSFNEMITALSSY